MAPEVYVHAARITPFRRGAESLEALAKDAAAPLLQGDKPGHVFVGNQGAEGFGDGEGIEARVAKALGLDGVPATRVAAATASGSEAFLQAVEAIKSGEATTTLVVGVERMTHVSTGAALGVLSNMLAEDERAADATPAALAALMANAYMQDTGLTREQLADVAVWMHEHGARNPDAQFQRAITRDEVMASAPIAEPLRLYDCAPTSDGAAALILSTEPGPVRVAGFGRGKVETAFTKRTDPKRLTSFAATRMAAAAAFREAGRSPEDVDVLELHDAFTILAPIAIEDLGLAKAGAGHAWLAEHRAHVNPGGGLKARGHPAGATGAAQLAELFMQLTGAAGARQVSGARVGLAHNVGGVGARANVTILEVAE